MYNVFAIDLSLNGTGYAFLHKTRRGGEYAVTRSLPVKKLKGMPRVEYVVTALLADIDATQPSLVVLEGYAYGKAGSSNNAFHIGEMTGVLKYEIYKRRIPILLVPASSLKLFATGKGNADKETVQACLEQASGFSFATNDEADAYGLFLMGQMSMDKNSWPEDSGNPKLRALKGCEFM